MGRVAMFYQTTVGKKVVMAATGGLFCLFLVGHLLGNLQIFLGAERLNAYAHFLKGLGELLWVVRGVMGIALVLHFVAAVQITLENWRARPVGYAVKKDIETSYAARTMIISGPLLLLYVIYHLMMFTLLWTDPSYSIADVYGNVVKAFQVPAISGIYIVAMLALGYHLSHGIFSMLNTLGLSGQRYHTFRKIVSPLVGLLIALGYTVIPVAVLVGFVH
jgi:succinate dehydrogenase / fumarate reductase cytochrome b subunit